MTFRQRVASYLAVAALLALGVALDAQTVSLPAANAQTSPGDSAVVTLPGPSQAAQKEDAHARELGSRLLSKVMAYVGGSAKLDAMRDITVTETSEMQSAQGPLTEKVVTYEVLPDTIRQEMQSARGIMVFYISGNTGWMLDAGGVHNLSDSDSETIQSELARNMMLLLIYLNSTTAAAIYQGSGDLRIINSNGEPMTLHVDEKTGEPQSIHYTFKNREILATYSEWRRVESLNMPFELDVEMDGRPILHMTTTRIQTNTNLKPAELAARPHTKPR